MLIYFTISAQTMKTGSILIIDRPSFFINPGLSREFGIMKSRHRKPLHRIAKQILLDFVNSTRPTFTARRIARELRNLFRCSPPDQKRSVREHKRLKKLFDELNNETNLFEIDSMHYYMAHYNGIRPALEIQPNGSMDEYPIAMSDDRRFYFEDALTYCVVKFFSNERNAKLVHKCENPECARFFVAKRVKQKGKGIKFCSTKCRLDVSNRRRIESGEHRDYKRKKRKEGAPESYYG